MNEETPVSTTSPALPRHHVAWLLTERVVGDEAMYALGIFTKVERAKLAAAVAAESEESPTWTIVSWDQGLNAYRTALLLIHKREIFEIEFWILPYILNRTEPGTEILHLPSKLGRPG